MSKSDVVVYISGMFAFLLCGVFKVTTGTWDEIARWFICCMMGGFYGFIVHKVLKLYRLSKACKEIQSRMSEKFSNNEK